MEIRTTDLRFMRRGPRPIELPLGDILVDVVWNGEELKILMLVSNGCTIVLVKL